MTPKSKYATPTRKSYLDTLVQQKIIKPTSRDWLTGALDPFHDFQFNPQGLPDQFSGSSVVQFIKRKVSILPPAGLAADAKWDAHIFTAPLMKTMDGKPIGVAPGYWTDPDLFTAAIGTVNVHVVPTGQPSLPNEFPIPITLPFPGRQTISPCDDGNDYSLMRLIGGGFEIHNDTADLYKNGSATVYAQPSAIELDHGVFGIDGIDPGYATGLGVWNKSRMPPSTISEATSNVNSITWSAADGCYVPFLLDIDECDFRQASAVPFAMTKVDSSVDFYSVSPAYGTALQLGPFGALAPVLVPAAPVRMASLETCGAYFTGLSSQTSLTLDVRFIVEVAPTAANTTLVSLASPSSEYDPDALVLYSRACRELPAGVKVSMNAGGDWWRIVSGAINWAAPIISKMGPYGAAAAGVAKGVQVIGDTVATHRQERRGTGNPRPPDPNAGQLKLGKKPKAQPPKKGAKTRTGLKMA